MNKPIAYIALGSNMPFEGVPPVRVLARAVSAIQGAGFNLQALSGIWESAAWPPSNQPDYLNAVVAIDPAGVSPQALYDVLRQIELQFGRERRERYAARTLDLDVVAIDGRSGAFGGIALPHPRMHERPFVLAPLDEVAPDWRHPDTGLSPSEMLDLLPFGHRYRRLSDFGPEAG